MRRTRPSHRLPLTSRRFLSLTIASALLAAGPGAVASASPGPAERSAASTSTAKTHAKGKAGQKKKRRKARAQTVPTFVSDYAGRTGAVFHRVQTSEVDVPGQGRIRLVEEAWFELDGGRRARRTTAGGPVTEGGFQPRWFTDDWSEPAFKVVTFRGAFPTPMPSRPYAQAGCPTQRETFRGSHGDLALWEVNRIKRITDQLAAGTPFPAGPVIDGHETIAVFEQKSKSFSQTLIIDRASGALRRIVASDTVIGYTATLDYPVWEVIPAGGSAANLAGTLPGDLELRRTGDCAAEVAPWAAGER